MGSELLTVSNQRAVDPSGVMPRAAAAAAVLKNADDDLDELYNSEDDEDYAPEAGGVDEHGTSAVCVVGKAQTRMHCTCSPCSERGLW